MSSYYRKSLAAWELMSGKRMRRGTIFILRQSDENTSAAALLMQPLSSVAFDKEIDMNRSHGCHLKVTSKGYALLFATALSLPAAAEPVRDSSVMTTGDLATAQGAGPAVVGQQMDVEEIKIIGERLIRDLQQRIYDAEDIAFNLFNDLNDDDRYDIHCVTEARTGTQIKKRMCLPNYYHAATRDNAMEFLGSMGGCDDKTGICASPFNYVAPSPSARNVISYRFPIFKAKVKEMVLKNRDMNKAMQDLFVLTDQLHEVREIYHHEDAEIK